MRKWKIALDCMPFQFHRFPMLVWDHDELREEDERGNMIFIRWRLKVQVEGEKRKGWGIKLIFFN